MPDFWRASGFHLLDRDTAGRLAVTDDFLRAYFARPELRPVAESCAAERALHAALLDDPRLPVPAERLARLADADVRDNYRVVLAFRDRLAAAGTLEACYIGLFKGGRMDVPPLFLDQLVHAIVRNVLESAPTGLKARAAELLFREQKVTIEDGQIMAADAETIEMYATTGGFGSLGRLVVEAQTPVRQIALDVIAEESEDIYWTRDERHDLVIDLTFARPGLDALCRVLETWVAHFLGTAVHIQPVQEIADKKWVWHSGLDAEGSKLLNDLYTGVEVDEARLGRLLSLFRLDFADPAAMRSDIAGRPVYLAMAMTSDGHLRLKPQNLLVNLPLARVA
jgi:hypothetical protein